MNKIKLKGGQFRLSRNNDGEGTFGPELVSIDPTTGDKGENGEIVVGKRLRCGNGIGRWWMTSVVVEIIEFKEEDNKVIIKTLNSEYVVEGRKQRI
jgi:hypothetical protein